MATTKTTPRRGMRRDQPPQRSGAQKVLGAVSSALPGLLATQQKRSRSGRASKASGLMRMLKRR